MEVLKQLLGRLHPIIVHLPIGILLAALLLQWTDRKKKSWTPVISKLFLWTAISATLACITGYLQYLGEGYAFSTVKNHLWFGIITTVFSFLMYLRLLPSSAIKAIKNLPITVLSVIMLLLIAYTGHLGGGITHGEDYLVEPLPNNLKAALGYETYEKQEIVLNEESWQETQLYDELIDPILNNNCVSCHNKKRAKGGLLLNSREDLLKGGENGEVLLAGMPEESPLYSRLILPDHHEDHMPPKDKPQPSKEEIALIKTWILADAPFEGTLGQLGLSKDIVASFFSKKISSDYPNVEIEKAPQDSINKIKDQGIHVQPISEASNFLSVSCINYPDFADDDFRTLLAIRDQIAILDLGGTQVSDSIFVQLGKLTHLTKLRIDHTKITGKGVAQLGHLNYLKVLNMTGTRFKKDHLSVLSQIKGLKAAYLFNTGLKEADHREFQGDSTFRIEFGNYELPKRASDSIVY